MRVQAINHTILRRAPAAALALALLVGAALPASARTGFAAHTAPAGLPGEYGPDSALPAPTDPNAESRDDVLVEWGEDSAGGALTPADPDQLAGAEIPELNPATLAGGAIADVDGEHPAWLAGDPAFSSFLFLPIVRRGSPGRPDMSAESSSALSSQGSAEAGGVATGGQGAAGDFNGDGYDDLAIAAPRESLTVNGLELHNAGAVTVLYGAPAGLMAAGSQVWTQDSAGVLGAVEPGDAFGCALAAGDFDGDGFTDLAAGVCGESIAGATVPSQVATAAGAVQIFYGTPAGLAAARNQLWTQDSVGMLDLAEANDRFGSALAAGDFDGDGRADLAIGVPDEDIAGRIDAGIVQMLYGSSVGLAALPGAVRAQVWHQSVGGMPELAEAEDGFGAALASGDFDGDGRAELAAAAPLEDLESAAGLRVDAGVVHVMRGSTDGLTAAGAQLFSEDAAGLRGYAEARDFFGWSLAAGDFDGSGAGDLAIGIPMEDFVSAGAASLTNAGAVAVVFSTGAAGLDAAASQVWTQAGLDTPGAGMADPAETGDTFGLALAAAAVGGGDAAALVVGVPSEDLEGGAKLAANAGAVHILHGPLGSGANVLWTQDSPGVLDAAEAGDGFGLTLAVGDFDGDGAADLAGGVPREDVGGILDAGAINILANPLGTAQHQFWSQDTAGLPGLGEHGDQFGYVGQ